ncbi:MAG TPA: Hsp33 family molecular chaperone HslO, partial [Rhodanobacteraceae bacterium]|nr:Hsp33 family molecular chaperone HslO [Rhodanobacteraceae bacterium]
DLSNDFLQRFLLERAGVRGVLVRLDNTWRDVRERVDYPPALASLLGEALAASALLTGNIKFDGRLSVQLRSTGALRLLFAECTADGHLRGLARWNEETDAPIAPASGALLAITIEQAGRDLRQQGLVSLEGGDLASAFERYFAQSEQLPSRIVLAEHAGRCAGLMLQPVAAAGGVRQGDADGWNRVGHLLATVTVGELTQLAADTLLTRLFHEENVRVFEPRPLSFACTCSRQRVEATLRALGEEECNEAIDENGYVDVTCEFCNQRYRLDRVDIAGLFAATPPLKAPRTAQ